MAKREIPEINAGSMADIAFLLLIFFLVTTTMEKDTAYIRQIPKKLEDVPPPPPIDKRNICAIKANNANQLMIRDEIMDDPDEISERIIEFYRMNEGLSQAQTEANIANRGYEGYNFPFYSRVTKDYIDQKIDESERDLDAAYEAEDDNLITFHEKALQEWSKKKAAISTLKLNELVEIQAQAHIRVEVQQKTDYRLFAKIHSEIEEAITELRDVAAEKYFGETYTKMTKRLALDKDDKKGDRKKIEALKILYPDRIIEVRPR